MKINYEVKPGGIDWSKVPLTSIIPVGYKAVESWSYWDKDVNKEKEDYLKDSKWLSYIEKIERLDKNIIKVFWKEAAMNDCRPSLFLIKEE